MEGYLGEFPVDVSTHTEYSKYKPEDWALLWIYQYGQIDGDHHKTWLLDKITQILNGSYITVTEARWDNGHTEYRFHVTPNNQYHAWVKAYEGEDENGDPEYSYSTGIAP